MTHIEKLHLEAIANSKFQTTYSPIPQIDENIAAKQSAEITKNIAIEFVLWIYYNEEWVSSKTNEELFQEYLKSKENDKRRDN